jgi:SHS2 domain-containing protein
MAFKYLEHPADIGFLAISASLEELFAVCGEALVALILDPSGVVADRTWTIEAEGDDQESLLVNWLNEVLFLIETRRLIFRSFSVAFPHPGRVTCEAAGELRDPARHSVRTAVKAVTYHQLGIEKTDSQWLAEVFVDV